MKTCGCPSDTLSSLLVTQRARDALGDAGLAEPSRRVNRPPYALSYLAPFALEFTRRSRQRVSSPQSPSNRRASFGRPMAGEDQGGGSRRPTQQGRGCVCDRLLGPRAPPPLPAPTRGGGCANGTGLTELHAARRRGAP